MTLREQIQNDMKAAMAAKDTQRLGALRQIAAAVHERDIDDHAELPDAQIWVLLQGMVARSREHVVALRQGGRPELALATEFDSAVFASYLPPQIEGEALDAIVSETLASIQPQGPQDLLKVITALRDNYAGRIDLAAASAKVKRALL